MGGRPRAIPARLIPELLQRHDRGEGYRMLSRWLKRCGIDASPAACRRAALGLLPYTDEYDLLRSNSQRQYLILTHEP
jgi:hypothetical protein